MTCSALKQLTPREMQPWPVTECLLSEHLSADLYFCQLIVRTGVGSCIVFLLLLSAGCATKQPQDVNKQLLDQALVLQEITPSRNSPSNNTASHNTRSVITKQTQGQTSLIPHGHMRDAKRLVWQFSEKELQLSAGHIQQLYQWLTTLRQPQQFQLVLNIGPDWLSSYQRGKAIRAYIPRGLTIRQQYHKHMAPHQVTMSLVKITTGSTLKPDAQNQEKDKQEKENQLQRHSLRNTSHTRIKHKTGAAWLEAVMRETSQ